MKNKTPGAIDGYRHHISILIVSMILLSMEITYTRIFSVLIWYHYTFLIVSISIFGLGTGGIIYYCLSHKMKNIFRVFKVALFLLPLSIITGLWIITHTFVTDLSTIIQVPLMLYYASFFSVFFIGGFVMTHIVRSKSEQISSIYFFDLLGAGIGSVLFILGSSLISPENAVVLLAILAIFPNIIFLDRAKPNKLFIILLIAMIVVFAAVMSSSSIKIENSPTKSLFKELKSFNSTIIITKYNSISRLDVTNKTQCAFWGKSSSWSAECPQAFNIRIDGDAATRIVKDAKNISFLAYDISAAGYYAAATESKNKALIIGSGGGIDALTASYFGFQNITAVEINPGIIQITNKLNPDIYSSHNIGVVIDNARSFLDRTKDNYDFIQISLIDSWAAVSSGSNTLTESYLYTADVFDSYYTHLTDNGIISITRWATERQKITALASQMLIKNGQNPSDHIRIISNNATKLNTFIIKKNAFNSSDIENLDKMAANLNYSVEKPGKLQKTDVPTDDKPFYFYNEIINSLLDSVLLFSLAIVLVMLVLPLVVIKKINVSKLKVLLLYFAMIGLAYIILELFLIQKFLIMFGSPSACFALVVTSLLVGTGIGSLCSKRLSAHLPKILLLLLAMLLFIEVFLSGIISATNQLDVAYRLLVTIIVIVPLGFCLGNFLPFGITASRKIDEIHAAYLLGTNGLFSALGAIIALKLAVFSGFTLLLHLAIILYAASIIIILMYKRSKS